MSNPIRQIFFGRFSFEYFSESLDELSLDMNSLEYQIQSIVSGNGNIDEPYDAYFITYTDDSSALLYLNPLPNGNYSLGGTRLYKMRQYLIHEASYTYNDCDPNQQLNYTASLTIRKLQVNNFGNIMIFKQRLKDKCIRLVGNIISEVSPSDLENLDIYKAIINTFTSTKYIELST
jgi:hypothetical protein